MRPYGRGESVSDVNDILLVGEIVLRLARDAEAVLAEAKQLRKAPGLRSDAERRRHDLVWALSSSTELYVARTSPRIETSLRGRSEGLLREER
jgi:hypothetical protein